MSAPVSLIPAVIFVGGDDDDDKPTKSGVPVFAHRPEQGEGLMPPPLLLQKELALRCQCHCRQCRQSGHFPLTRWQ